MRSLLVLRIEHVFDLACGLYAGPAFQPSRCLHMREKDTVADPRDHCDICGRLDSLRSRSGGGNSHFCKNSGIPSSQSPVVCVGSSQVRPAEHQHAVFPKPDNIRKNLLAYFTSSIESRGHI